MTSLLEYFKIFILVLSMVFAGMVYASDVEFQAGKFYYIRSGEVNFRAGPDKRYPIRWVMKSRGEPVVVLMEFDGWVKIKDIDGDGGWVHGSMLSAAKNGILLGGKRLEMLRSGPSDVSKPIARLEPGIRFSIKKCLVNNWCSVSLDGLKGWVHKKNIWGIE
jgi:SH3-like domain-containing protein